MLWLETSRFDATDPPAPQREDGERAEQWQFAERTAQVNSLASIRTASAGPSESDGG